MENGFKRNPCQGRRSEFGSFAKTQGILFAQVVNSLILKKQDIAIFATKSLKSHSEGVRVVGLISSPSYVSRQRSTFF